MSLSNITDDNTKKIEAEVIDVDNEDATMKPLAAKKIKTKISASAHIEKHHDPLTTQSRPYRFGVPGGPIFEREGKIKRLVVSGYSEKIKKYWRDRKSR